ncbi:TIGR03986 family type III CRISPR-associated RAMP protein [Agarivorans sp. Z349TD_8]|uniref:TIGR03986 family type III CRISPR-associated RAMP protein n=1 Tax=Agarivorans sp. Z349TD_8 TaxID=3421434 RepID=UPI003D7DBF6A
MSKTIKPPYHFVPVLSPLLNANISRSPRIDHSKPGNDSLSGQLYCEIETLTPAIFGAFQAEVSEPLSSIINKKFGRSAPPGKKVISPQTVELHHKKLTLIQGSSIKGMVASNLAAIGLTPMARVQERTFSYRPNLKPAKSNSDTRCQVYAAVVEENTLNQPEGRLKVRVLTDLLDTRNNIKSSRQPGMEEFSHYSNTDKNGYFARLFSSKSYSTNNSSKAYVLNRYCENYKELVIKPEIIQQFNATTEHLCDKENGHLSSANPNISKAVFEKAGLDIEKDLDKVVQSIQSARDLSHWQPGFLFYVDINIEEAWTILSFGNNYYYHWLYLSSTTNLHQFSEKGCNFVRRKQLKPLEFELDAKPTELNLSRAIFGFSGDNDEDDKQAGKVSFNHAIEQLDNSATVAEQDHWFALDISGQPKPSAYEFYITQSYKRPIYSYGTLQFSGEVRDKAYTLAGRKFYWHQDGFNKLWQSKKEKSNQSFGEQNALLSRGVTPKGKRYRFNVKFRAMTEFELGGLLLALSPQLIHDAVPYIENPRIKKLIINTHHHLALKLGNARPQGFGSIKLTICKANTIAKVAKPDTKREQGLVFNEVNFSQLVGKYINEIVQRVEEKDNERGDLIKQLERVYRHWLKLHEYLPDQLAEYPQLDGKTFKFHQKVRQSHCEARRAPAPESKLQPAPENIALDSAKLPPL